jgi:hypothetical protein
MVKLAEMIMDVRNELSDIPEDKVSDLQIYLCLKDAKSYVDQVVIDTATTDQLNDCYKSVGVVYAYVNWTSLAERLMGTQPTTSFARVQFLREKAISRLQLIAKYPLNRDLTVNLKWIADLKVDGAVLTSSILEEYTEDS